MSERERRRIERLLADRALIREAATVVRTAPTEHPDWAVLSKAKPVELLSSMLDHIAERLEYMPDPDRAHLVRVASTLCGRPMDQPRIRRTRRR